RRGGGWRPKPDRLGILQRWGRRDAARAVKEPIVKFETIRDPYPASRTTITTKAAADLIDRARPRAGAAVLDIAYGAAFAHSWRLAQSHGRHKGQRPG